VKYSYEKVRDIEIEVVENMQKDLLLSNPLNKKWEL
jgi:hypothetical protein